MFLSFFTGVVRRNSRPLPQAGIIQCVYAVLVSVSLCSHLVTRPDRLPVARANCGTVLF